MAPNRSSAQPKSLPGVKTLVTAAALAATVAGWATLSAQNQVAATEQSPATPDVDTPIMVTATPPTWLLQAPSIAAPPAVATVRPVSNAPVLSARSHQAPPAVAAAAPDPAPAQAPAQAPAAALREVAPPPQPTARPAAPPPAPRPATNTRSSR
jgi:hypothetical protein